jgi:hypothetical protein
MIHSKDNLCMSLASPVSCLIGNLHYLARALGTEGIVGLDMCNKYSSFDFNLLDMYNGYPLFGFNLLNSEGFKSLRKHCMHASK